MHATLLPQGGARRGRAMVSSLGAATLRHAAANPAAASGVEPIVLQAVS